MMEQLEDIWDERRAVEHRLKEGPPPEETNKLNARLRELNAALEDKKALEFQDTGGDVLIAYWNAMAEQGIMPDLDLGPDSPEVVAWVKERGGG